MRKSEFLKVFESLPVDFINRYDISLSTDKNDIVFGNPDYVSIRYSRISDVEFRDKVIQFNFKSGYFCLWLNVDSSMLVIS